MKIGPSEVSGFTVFLQGDVRAKLGLVPEVLIDLQQCCRGRAAVPITPVQSD